MRLLFILAVLSVLGLQTEAQNFTPTIEYFNSSIIIESDPNDLVVNFLISDSNSEIVKVEIFVKDTNLSIYSNDAIIVGEPQTLSLNYYTSNNLKLVVTDDEQLNIEALVSQVNTDSISYYLNNIVGARHRTSSPEHLADVKNFIEDRFNKHNYESTRQNVPHGSYTGENIIGLKSGETNNTYIVDAHFDTVNNSPGADDNGSGVAGVLEVARVLKLANFTDNLVFIGFDLEEEGLVGSIEYVTNGIAEDDTIKGVFNFEMIGYYDENPNTQTLPAGFGILFPQAAAQVEANDFKGDFINNIANTNSAVFMQAYEDNANEFVPDLKVISFAAPSNSEIAPDLRRSDHTPFWEAGIPAVMLSDGANFRNPNYHSINDTLGALNTTFMANVVKATVASIAKLAKIKNVVEAETEVVVTVSNSQIIDNNVVFINVNNQLKIEVEQPNFTWKLMDIKGAIIQQGVSNTAEFNYSTQNLDSGIYLFEVVQNKKSKIFRFLK